MKAASLPRGVPLLRMVLISSLIPALLVIMPGIGQAQIRPYFYMEGKALTAESTFQDEWLDNYTERDRSPAWEFGAGIRILGGELKSKGVSEWEFRAGLGYGRGELEGATYSGYISDWRTRDKYPFESHESYSFTNWTVRTSFMYNIRPRYGFSIGPAVEIANYDGKRKWDGPDGYYRGGDAEDASTVRYGIMELGAHVRLLPWPVLFETYWIPKRVELSTKHIRRAENWRANFASLEESMGIRFSYLF